METLVYNKCKLKNKKVKIKLKPSQADESLQLAVDDYHRANGVHRAAKETIRLMEQSLNEIGGKQDGVSEAWQESIRRNVKRLQEAEQERFVLKKLGLETYAVEN